MRSLKKTTIVFVAILLLLLLSFVSAELNKRDPQAPSGGTSPPPASATPAATTPSATPAGTSATPAGTSAPTPTPTGGSNATVPAGNSTATPGNSTTTATNYTTMSAPPNTQPVTVQMVTPAQQQQNSNILFPIGTNITFQWTYSSMFYVPPQSILVYAQPTVDKNRYILIQNTTLNTTMQTVIWNTANITPRLPMSNYQLYICDQRGINAPAVAGGLAVYSSFSFALYDLQDGGDATCPNCNLNNAISISIIPLLSTIGLTLITITIISFNFIY